MCVQFVAPKTILFSALPIIDWYFNYVIKNLYLHKTLWRCDNFASISKTNRLKNFGKSLGICTFGGKKRFTVHDEDNY